MLQRSSRRARCIPPPVAQHRCRQRLSAYGDRTESREITGATTNYSINLGHLSIQSDCRHGKMRRSRICNFARQYPTPIDCFAQNILACKLIRSPGESLMDQRGIAEPFQRDKFVARTSFCAIQCTKEVRQPILCGPRTRRFGRSRDVATRRLSFLLHRRKCDSNRVGVWIPISFEFGVSPLFSISAVEMYFALITVWQ